MKIIKKTIFIAIFALVSLNAFATNHYSGNKLDTDQEKLQVSDPVTDAYDNWREQMQCMQNAYDQASADGDMDPDTLIELLDKCEHIV